MEHRMDEGSGARIEESAMAVVMCGERILATVELIYGKETLSLPKGHREAGEDLLDTAIRECFEETNIELTRGDLVRALPSYSYEFLTPAGQLVRKVIAPFLFRAESEGTPLPKEKRMLAVQWMKVGEFIEQCTHENVRDVVKHIIA